MNKYFYLLPRQTGKSTMAIYEYLKDPENSLLIVHNQRMIQDFKVKTPELKNIMTPQMFLGCRGKSWKNIILDEYLFFNNKDQAFIYNEINLIEPENLYIFTTSNKVYDRRLYDIIKEQKPNFNKSLLLGYILSHTTLKVNIKTFINNFHELYFNFLTDPDTKLITKPFFNIRTIRPDYELEMSKLLPSDAFKLEILNIFLDDDIIMNNVWQ